MKKLMGGLMVLMLGGLGCTKESPPAGPGASRTQAERSYQVPQTAEETQVTPEVTTPEVTNEKQTFTLVVPSTETDLTRGKRKEVKITINRGGDFKQTVKLQFKLPSGLTIEPAEPVINPDETEAKVTLEADADAMLGETNIEVTAVPETGKTASMRLAIEIHED